MVIRTRMAGLIYFFFLMRNHDKFAKHGFFLFKNWLLYNSRELHVSFLESFFWGIDNRFGFLILIKKAMT